MRKRLAACLVLMALGLAACASTSSTTTTSTAAMRATTSTPSRTSATPSHPLKLEPLSRLLGRLFAVSCGGPENCVAVGAGYKQPLLLEWHNGVWSKVSLTGLVKAGRVFALGGVSCPVVANCMVVGQVGLAPLVLHLSGDRISVLATPKLHGGMSAVSCTTADACYAVGGEVARWNGTGWAVMVSEAPAKSSGFTGVSCFGGLCMAVGVSAQPSNAIERGFADRLEGGRWVLTRNGRLPLGAESRLESVACNSPSSCVAAGGWFSQNGVSGGPFIERWSTDRWTTVSLSGAPPLHGSPSILSCPGPATCFAVGAQLILHEVGQRWSVLTAPDHVSLDDVSCWSADGCLAVGVAGNGLDLAADQWNGTTWSALRL